MRLILKENKHGKAVFASRDIKRGDYVITFKGDMFHKDQIKKGTYLDEHSILTSPKVYLGPSGDFDDYINHSCRPNCGVILSNGELRLVAIKKIRRGKEITFDYSSCENDTEWKMECDCGCRRCRGTIGSFKSLPKNIKSKYLRKGVVPEFVEI